LSLAIFHSFLKTLKNKSNQTKEFSSERKNESTIFVFVVSISRLIFGQVLQFGKKTSEEQMFTLRHIRS